MSQKNNKFYTMLLEHYKKKHNDFKDYVDTESLDDYIEENRKASDAIVVYSAICYICQVKYYRTECRGHLISQLRRHITKQHYITCTNEDIENYCMIS
jgi:hypothetical protein